MTYHLSHALAASCALASLAAAQTTTLVTIGPGGQSDFGSLYAELSADARWITYQSGAANLVPGDTNGGPDIFLFDRDSGTTTRISVAADGTQANGDSLDPHISLDGRYVTHFSYASNLVAGDTNGKSDVFVHDSWTGAVTRASVGPAGAQGDGGSRYPVLSGDGASVAFGSTSTNLVADDTNGVTDVFVHELATGITVRASVAADGSEANGQSLDASLSPDGRYLAFESDASNLVPGDTNGVSDVFVKDLWTGAIERISLGSNGVEGNGPSTDPSLSDGALFCSFESDATNLTPNDGNAWHDVFVRDLTAGTTVLGSVALTGVPGHLGAYEGTLSGDGRLLAFYSQSSNLVPDDTNSAVDIFLRDLATETTERISVGGLGQQGEGNAFYPALTPDGRYLAFDSTAPNLVLGDENQQRDIFLRDRLAPFRPFCAGDGSLATPCPCGNTGQGGRGCASSAESGGGALVANGETSPDSVRLQLAGVPPGALCIVLQSSASQVGGVVFHDGLRCLAGPMMRLYAQTAEEGTVSFPGPFDPPFTLRSAHLGDPIAPGETRFYQAFYREPDARFCSPGRFNATNALRIGW